MTGICLWVLKELEDVTPLSCMKIHRDQDSSLITEKC